MQMMCFASMMLRFAQTEFPHRVLKNTEKRAIINSERRCYNEKSIFFFTFALLGSFAYFLSGQLVWKPFRCSVVFYSRSRSCPVCRFVCDYDIQNIRMPEMQNRIQAKMVSSLYYNTF